MPEALILEFPDADPALYDDVNRRLGLDPDGDGEWPAGILHHSAGEHEGGNGLTVWEIWESRDAQEAFMSSRLGPALHEAGAPQPSRMEWMAVRGNHTT